MMKNFALASVLALATASAAFANGGDLETVKVDSITMTGDLMPRTSPRQSPIRTRIQFSVVSNGCTYSDHFSVKVEKKEDVQKITLVRGKADLCKRTPSLVDLSVSTTELNRLLPVRIMNPFPIQKGFTR